MRRLPLADQGGEILGEVDRLGDLGLLGAQLGELRRLGLGALGLAAEHEPRRPAWGQRRGRGLRHDRQRLPPALASGGQALRLAQATGRGGDAAIAPRVALGLELPEELHRRPAARIPARQEIIFIRIEDTAPIRAAVLRPGPRRQAQIPFNGVPAVADLRGDRRDRPPLAVQGPHRVRGGLPAGRTLGGLLLGARRRGRGWYRHRDRPIGQRHGLWAHGRIDRLKGLGMRGEDLLQRCREVLQEMKPVRDLGGRGGALASALRIGL